MRVQVNLWNYDRVVNNADRILRYQKAEDDRLLMPPYGSGGPWPDEWVQLFRCWAYSGFKPLELGRAQYNFDSATNTILATGTFPTAGYAGWLQIVTETDSSRAYVLYFEGPDAAVTRAGEPFSLEEPYEGP